MTTQLLIYETAVAVSHRLHTRHSVDNAGFAFSRGVNAVPLMAVEFPSATSEYCIVFAGEGESLMPSVILGMRGKENAYLNAEEGWRAKYIPAFIRRYPFVFSKSDDGETFTLCIDEAFPGFNVEGRGQALFDNDGKPTPYVNNVLTFLKDYQSQFQRTRAFCAKLQTLDLLEPMQATMSLETGENLSLTGFRAINRAKLKELPADVFADLVRTDELELIYLHLHSMRNFSNARERLVVISGGKDKGQATPQVASETDDRNALTA
jgi:hypothetical protein